MLDGLDDAIVGLSADEETSYEGQLAAGEHADEKALIRVKVTAVKERELPAADDEFAQMASEFDTLDELRADIRSKVAENHTAIQAIEAKKLLLDRLESVDGVILPKKLIAEEVKERLERQGKVDDPERMVEVTAETEATYRTQIVLDQLADDLDISVEEEELLDYVVTVATRLGIDPEKFLLQSQKTHRIPLLVAEVARMKALSRALRQVKVVDTAGKAIDISGVIGTDESDAERAKAFAEAKAERAAASAVRKKSAAKKSPTKKAPGNRAAAKKK
jgi:trigger factor